MSRILTKQRKIDAELPRLPQRSLPDPKEKPSHQYNNHKPKLRRRNLPNDANLRKRINLHDKENGSTRRYKRRTRPPRQIRDTNKDAHQLASPADSPRDVNGPATANETRKCTNMHDI